MVTRFLDRVDAWLMSGDQMGALKTLVAFLLLPLLIVNTTLLEREAKKKSPDLSGADEERK